MTNGSTKQIAPDFPVVAYVYVLPIFLDIIHAPMHVFFAEFRMRRKTARRQQEDGPSSELTAANCAVCLSLAHVSDRITPQALENKNIIVSAYGYSIIWPKQ